MFVYFIVELEKGFPHGGSVNMLLPDIGSRTRNQTKT